jgi:predicted nucleotidyltransferase
VLSRLAAHRGELTRLGIRSLALFGSVARGEDRPGSDIDLLVEFSRPTSLFELFDIRRRLEEILGRRVDLVPRDGLKPRIRDAVLREAIDAA